MAHSALNVGILALQGDFEQHVRQIRLLGARSQLVKLPKDLAGLEALVIPGGESTTMSILMDRFDLRATLTEFCRTHPVYATCAGMIMLATEIEENLSSVKSLELLDITVERNGYGRQIHSSDEELTATLNGHMSRFRASFIRAPRILRTGKSVEILSRFHDDPALIRQKNILAAVFHAELADDTTILRFFFDNFFR